MSRLDAERKRQPSVRRSAVSLHQPSMSLSVVDLRQPSVRRSGRVTRKRECKYSPTPKNRKTLRRWKSGKSIGFTQTASLKAKGLIPRSSGKKIISDKYC